MDQLRGIRGSGAFSIWIAGLNGVILNYHSDCPDVDGDGYTIFNDCDDKDPLEFPGQTWYIDADADNYGGSAPQRPIPLMAVGDISEDCLYLNIWTPACDDKKRPVMFWVCVGLFIAWGEGSCANPRLE